MALDRQSIEKRDFPIGRRGYDPAAVDAHLNLLADELEAAKRSSRGGGALASAASEQVRLIVEAAEQSASDIEREADLEARRIRQEAREAAETARTEAGDQAREHVARVSEAANAMLERIDSMQNELRGLLDSLRTGATRVTSDLSTLQTAVGDLRGAASPGFEPDPFPARTTPAASFEPDPVEDFAADPLDDALVGESAADKPADEEGARLIAFNMALNGTPREETETYLLENFELEDPAGLLDDVYAQAGL